MTIDEAIEAFTRHLEGERRASPRTVEEYRADVEGLAAFARDRGSRAVGDVRAVDVYLLRGWLGGLARTHAASSIARKVAAVRTWMRWLRRRGVIAACPADELATPKVRRGLPTFLSVDAAREVVEAPDDGSPRGLRDRAILEVLYGSGLRVSEVCGLDVADVDLPGGSARVIGKGSKERLVPLGSKCIAALERWLEARPAMVHPRRKTAGPARALPLDARPADVRARRAASSSSATARSAPAAPTCTPTRSATPARRTCSTAAPISAPSRRCSATRRSRRRSVTPTCRWST